MKVIIRIVLTLVCTLGAVFQVNADIYRPGVVVIADMYQPGVILLADIYRPGVIPIPLIMCSTFY